MSKYLISLMGLLILAFIISFASDSTTYLLVRKLDFSPLPVISPLVIIIILLILVYFEINLIKSDRLLFQNNEKANIIKVFFSYLILFVSGLFTIFLIQYLYERSEIDFKVDALLNTTIEDLLWFAIFLALFYVYFVFSLWISMTINYLNIGFRNKTIMVCLNALMMVIFIISVEWQIPLVPFILSFLIYIYVLDIYIERLKLNSSWIFTFMIVISGFTSLIIFSVYSNNLYKARISELKDAIYVRNSDFEQNMKDGKIADIEFGHNYIADTNFTTEKVFVKRLNSGYLKLNDSIYFNALNGDYINQLTNSDPAGRLSWICYYNREFVLKAKRSSDLSKYIIWFEDQIIFNNSAFNKIPVESDINEINSVQQFIKNGYSYSKYKTRDNIEIVNVQKIPDFLRPLSLFSLLFVLSGIFVFFLSILNSKFEFLPNQLQITFKGLTSLKSRIQGSIIGLFLLSFLIIGIIAFSYIKSLSINYQKDGAGIIVTKLNSEIAQNKDYSVAGIQNLLLEKYKDEGELFYLYDSKGKLIEDERRKSNTDDLYPLQQIEIRSDDTRFHHEILKESGKELLITVFPVRIGGDVFSICGYSSDDKLYSSTASNVLSNFLNIYVFLFLLSGSIAIAVANSITKPVDKLRERLNTLNLNERNEVLEWKNNDEIGQLIDIYNNAIKKLEESKKIITKIERDSAWREMAKQVAHEIKNPLTPLKLNIQYLQGIVANYPERAAEMITQLAPGLIEQINNLDKIATEFSDFAKMPKARNEKVNLNEIVTVVHDFFRKREDMSIILYVPINDMIVFADKNHMVSILNNIIKNAIQAIPNEREGNIVIDLYKEGENAIIKITDNGTGIPDEMVDKVFSPNFTTKSSGTGLGLAISTNMIQAFNGKIYFKTKIGEGTSFFVEIPLMRIKDNFTEQKIVSLDD